MKTTAGKTLALARVDDLAEILLRGGVNAQCRAGAAAGNGLLTGTSLACSTGRAALGATRQQTRRTPLPRQSIIRFINDPMQSRHSREPRHCNYPDRLAVPICSRFPLAFTRSAI